METGESGGALHEDLADDAPRAQDALIFAIGDVAYVRHTFERLASRDEPGTSLGAVIKYVEQHRNDGARLTPLYGERSFGCLPEDGEMAQAQGWQVALPDWSTEGQSLSAFHYLQLCTSELAIEANGILKELLDRDPLILYSYHPAIPYTRDLPPDPSPCDFPPFWWLAHCGFTRAWSHLEIGTPPGPIGVIDEGPKYNHPEIRDQVTEIFLPLANPARVPHASAVSAVIAARRGNGGIDGCCSAFVNLINVTSDLRINRHHFIDALKKLSNTPLTRVINVSLFMGYDECVRRQVEDCAYRKIAIVAAMGNDGGRVCRYPAAYENVIAVGATTCRDRKMGGSNIGNHNFISAPGQNIRTVSGATTLENRHGTSYAAPMVSAAAWLALHLRPQWGVPEIKCLLKKSVKRLPQPRSYVGHGRLDMCEMVRVLKQQEKTGMNICTEQ